MRPISPSPQVPSDAPDRSVPLAADSSGLPSATVSINEANITTASADQAEQEPDGSKSAESLADEPPALDHSTFVALSLPVRHEDAPPSAPAAPGIKSDFLANMSHEIRTPMNAILGFAEILADELPQGEHREHALSVVQASHSLLRIMNTFLDYSKIEAGSFTLHPVGFSPGALARESLREFEAAAQEKGIQLYLDLAEDIPAKIFLDEMRLREILLHLLDNATKFTHAGSIRLEVAWGPAKHGGGNCLIFEITDTGEGLVPELATRIFHSHETAAEPAKGFISGSGLGLVFCQKLAGLLGGELTFRPSTTTVGSTFSLALSDIHVLESAGDPEAHDSGLRENDVSAFVVLVVDDVEANRDLLKAFLTSMGLRVLTACDGIEALETLAGQPVHLVLTDLKMPRLNGQELAQAIHRQSATTHARGFPIPEVILATADTTVRQNPPGEFAAILEKPIRKSCLRDIINRFLPASVQPAFSDNLTLPPLLSPIGLSPALRQQALHLRQTLRVRGVRLLAEEILREARDSDNSAVEEYAKELMAAAYSLRIPRLRRLLDLVIELSEEEN